MAAFCFLPRKGITVNVNPAAHQLPSMIDLPCNRYGASRIIFPLEQFMRNEPTMPNFLLTLLRNRTNENYRSVKRLLIVLTGSVFFIEMIVMEALLSFTHISKTKDALLDATLLSVLLFPVFYYQIFRPLIRNIAEHERIEAELRIAAVAFEIQGPALITDANANIVRANQKFLEKSGFSVEELVGQNPRIFQSGQNDKKYYAGLWKELLQSGSWSGEIRIKTKEGRISHPFWLTITAVKNEKQETTHYIGIYSF